MLCPSVTSCSLPPRVFECVAFVQNLEPNRDKLAPRSLKCLSWLLSNSKRLLLLQSSVAQVLCQCRCYLFLVHYILSFKKSLSFVHTRSDIFHTTFGHSWIHFYMHSSFSCLSEIQEQTYCITWFSSQHIIFNTWGSGSQYHSFKLSPYCSQER